VRLLYVLDRFPVLSETFVVDEVRGLLRAGDDVAIYERGGGEDGVADDLLELRVGPGVRPPTRGLGAALGLRERGAVHALAQATWLAKRVRADHVHAHFAFGAASIALLYGRLTGASASFTAHAYDLYGGVADRVLRRKVAAATWAASPTEHGAARLRACTAPSDRDKVVVQRNGVARAQVDPGPPETPARVVAVGRLVEKKGMEALVRAAAKLDPSVVVEIVGDGPQRARLEHLAQGRVAFTGALPHAETLARLRGASAFALPCRELPSGDRDGLPVALVEAMSAGVPVVTTPVGGIPELVRDGETGLLAVPGDAESVATAITSLLRDASLRSRLATAGRAATEPWDAQRCIAQLRARFS
jgi:glycosyltransferase involved in cell wall biosynthesis